MEYLNRVEDLQEDHILETFRELRTGAKVDVLQVPLVAWDQVEVDLSSARTGPSVLQAPWGLARVEVSCVGPWVGLVGPLGVLQASWDLLGDVGRAYH